MGARFLYLRFEKPDGLIPAIRRLLGSQCQHWIHAGGAAGGDEAGNRGDQGEKAGDRQVYGWIERLHLNREVLQRRGPHYSARAERKRQHFLAPSQALGASLLARSAASPCGSDRIAQWPQPPHKNSEIRSLS